MEGVRKEVSVKTPFNAIEKWYELKPEIFTEKPIDFKNKLLELYQDYYSGFLKQPRETWHLKKIISHIINFLNKTH